jgi:predicted GNAT family acetyltransferase
LDLSLNEVAIVHDEEAHRFEAQVDGLRALIAYRRFPDRIVFTHTEVPPPFEGKGLAAKLVRMALDFARANHLRVVPLCPYVASFIRRHSEYLDLVSAEDLLQLKSSSNSLPLQ